MNKIESYMYNESITNFKHSRVKKTQFIQSEDEAFEGTINYEKLYIPIEYPVRREFKEYIRHNKIEKQEPTLVYSGFENKKIDFSTFLGTPHILQLSAVTSIYAQSDFEADFQIKLCGEALIELNGQEVVQFSPLTRVIPEPFDFKLKLKKGENTLVIHLRDLTERDINFSFELINKSSESISTCINVNNLEKLTSVERLLSSFSFEKDIINEEYSNFTYDSTHIDNPIEIDFEIRHNDIPYLNQEFIEENNPIQASLDEKLSIVFTPNTDGGSINLKKVKDFSSFILLKYIEDDMYIVRRLFLSKYTESHISIDNIAERKQYALNYIAENGKDTMLKVYARIQKYGKVNEETKEILENQLKFIRDRNDCADFEIIGLQKIYNSFKLVLPKDVVNQIEEVLLGFRYWTDEPGSDVMWYFSENHALSFHTAQFISGNIFKNDKFVNSDKFGYEQIDKAKIRLLDWFEVFNKHGLGEWNSTTYIPIDLNALLALYDQQYDLEIRNLAKVSLDYCFQTIENNFTGKLMSASYGRVYETELKAMEFGELAFVTWIMWNTGFINWSSRSTGMLCLSDYYYPYNQVSGLISKLEGHSNVNTINYKYEHASISSVNSYLPNTKGLQQHVFNVSLPEEIQIWLNHPGELNPSGEGRPSYWAGNKILPSIVQQENKVDISWNLNNELVQFVHMYYPGWKCEIKCEGNAIKVLKDEYVLEIITDSHYELITEGANKNKEVRFHGTNIKLHIELYKVEKS